MYLGSLSEKGCFSWGQGTPVECPSKAFPASASGPDFFFNVKRFQGKKVKSLITNFLNYRIKNH